MSALDFQTVLDAVSDAVLVVEADGRVAYANPGAGRLLGALAAALVTKPVGSLFEASTRGQAEDAVARPTSAPLHLTLAPSAIEVEAVVAPCSPGADGAERTCWTLRPRATPMPAVSARPVVPPVPAPRLPSDVGPTSSRPAASSARGSPAPPIDPADRDLAFALRSLGDGIITTDLEGNVTFLNDVAELLTGWPAREAVGRPLSEVFLILNEGDRTIAESPVARVLREGSSVDLSQAASAHALALTTALVARTGTVSSIENSGTPIRDAEGSIIGVVLVFRDVTQMRRAANRRRFLAQAAATLAASLDYGETLTNVAHLAVPRLADWCVVYVVDERGEARPLAVAHVDSSKIAAARELTREYVEEADAPTGVRHVIKSGQSVMHAYPDDADLARLARDTRHLELLRTLGIRSAMVVPLVAHGRALGAIVFVVADNAHRYEEADLLMAEELAARAAFAIDNARLHRSLQEGEERIRLVLDSAGEAIVGMDVGGRCVFANPACARLLGYRGTDDLVGRSLQELVNGGTRTTKPSFTGASASASASARRGGDPGDDVGTAAGRIERLCLEGEGVHVPEELLARADGSTFWAELWSYPIEREGERVGAVITFVDITDRKRAEQEHARVLVELEEAVRLRDDFLSIASHELRTPLTPLQLHVQGIQRAIRRGKLAELSPGDLSDKLDAVARQIHRMERLVDSLLDIARITGKRMQLQTEKLDLAPLVEEIAARHHEELERAACTLELDIEGSAVGVWDRLRLDQVISNLLGNAIKFGAGKPVGVKLKIDHARHAARLVVRDHGIGIAPEDQRRIFERFERAVPSRHYGGFGLGLWIVRQIVEAMGGLIGVESTPGEGAAFTVELPLSEAASREVAALSSSLALTPRPS